MVIPARLERTSFFTSKSRKMLLVTASVSTLKSCAVAAVSLSSGKKTCQLLDEVAYDGRWAYSEDKLLSYPNDVKPENLKAVTDYIKEHGVY